jgi:hypothetical protein
MVVPQPRRMQVCRRAPDMQKHAYNHAQRRRSQKHDGHLPGHDLEQTRDLAPGSRAAALAVGLSEQVADVVEAVAVRGEAVQTHGLVRCGQDAE